MGFGYGCKRIFLAKWAVLSKMSLCSKCEIKLYAAIV